MKNSERLLLYTLPRWAGVTALSVKELLSDMWLGGEEAGHHSDMPYHPEGSEKLRIELLKDFVSVPPAEAFGSGGRIRTVHDLDAAMADIQQTPVPSPTAMLAALLPEEELATLLRGRIRKAIFRQAASEKERRKSGPRVLRRKKGSDRHGLK
jgi:hypothetical protein